MNDGSDPYMNQAVLPKGYSIWAKPGDIATNPSPQNSSNSTETSTRYLKDGNFLSIRNITLSYQLPVSYLQKLKMNQIVVVTPGVSDFKYPNNRQFLFNIDFKF